jgi:ankyrin repeat protein
MPLNTVPNEIVLFMGDYLTKSSLNALIQTQKRFATLLTPHLYDDEIRFLAQHPEMYEDNSYSDPRIAPPLRCLECAPRWRSENILCYLRNLPCNTFGLADIHGRTLLHHIATRGNAKLVEICLAKGANIEARDKCNETPLSRAVSAYQGPSEELVDALLRAGADATVTHANDISVLVAAIIHGRSLPVVKRVIQALEATSDDIFAPCTSSDVLHRSIFAGIEPITRLLLDFGADIDTPDSYGCTPLTAAAIYGYNDIVNLLLDRGADVLPYDGIGRSALTSGTPTLTRVTLGRLLKATVSAGRSISEPSGDESWTPLHHSALNGDIASMALLINSGADVSASGNNGVTPLTCALVRYGDDEIRYEEVCRILIQAMVGTGADLSVPSEVPTGSNMTPLHLAIDLEAESIVQLLIANGAKISALDTERQSKIQSTSTFSRY